MHLDTKMTDSPSTSPRSLISRLREASDRSKQFFSMSQLSLNKFSENLPVSGTIGLSQAAAGVGLGLLIADKLSGTARRRTGSVLLVAGALALAPVIASLVTRVRNRPHSSSRARRHLESIRDDVGFHEADDLI